MGLYVAVGVSESVALDHNAVTIGGRRQHRCRDHGADRRRQRLLGNAGQSDGRIARREDSRNMRGFSYRQRCPSGQRLSMAGDLD